MTVDNDTPKMDEYDDEYEQQQNTVQTAMQYQTGVMTQFGAITTNSIRPVIETILNCHVLDNKIQNFVLVINSGGGSLLDAFALIDVIKGSKIPIYTVGIGQICSAGLLLFLAGQKGHRILTPNTTIMSHQWTGFLHGKTHELISTRKHHELIDKMVMSHLKSTTGLTAKQIKETLLPAHDVYLTAKEALKYGICDKIKSFQNAIEQ